MHLIIYVLKDAFINCVHIRGEKFIYFPRAEVEDAFSFSCFFRRFTFARIDISYARFFSTKVRKKYYHMRV